MPHLQPPEQPRLLKPRPEKVLASARRLFQERKIKWTYHADDERMPERSFNFFDVEEVIMKGYTPEPVLPGRRAGEWKIKVVYKLEGDTRKTGVVCVVANDRLLIIVTTEWEDK